MKRWLIKANAPICGTDTIYLAYCNNDPLKIDGVYEQIVEELWDSYSYLLHLDDIDDEDERIEAEDEAYNEWMQDCDIYAEEATDEEIEMLAPAGDVNNIDIIVDDRNEE